MNKLQHLAIIMDGNGRFALSLGKERTYGHYLGVKNVRNIAIAASNLGVRYLTLYAFSTENWKRPLSEVTFLMGLPKIFFNSYLKELMLNNIKVTMIGKWDKIPLDAQKYFKEAIEKTANNTGMTLCFALNYGSRDEIDCAAKKIALAFKSGEISDLNNLNFANYLYTKEMPDVDLLIRTSGEQRLSNFLLYQLAYSELMFVDCSWPEFDENELNRCLEKYYNRHRRFGGL